MAARLPRSLTKKRSALVYERQQLHRRLAAIDAEIRAIDYSLRRLKTDYLDLYY